MKIGAFSKKNKTSIDTIRHYIDLNLIIPLKENGQFDFDRRCQTDYDEVCHLKSIGFTLHEIQTLMIFKRIGRFTDYENGLYYNVIYKDKQKEIEQELKRLQNIKLNLKTQIELLDLSLSSNNFKEKEQLGVPLELLSLLSCPSCHKSLILKEGAIINQQVISGHLSCVCGQSYEIKEGILGNKNLMVADQEHNEHQFIEEYIIQTDKDYLLRLNKSLEWLNKKVKFKTNHEQVFLELGTGHGFFLRSILDQIPDTAIYIAVDHNLNSMTWLKHLLEAVNPKFKILFICTDFLEIPIKQNAVDVLLDLSGSSNYAFDHERFLLYDVQHLLKQSCDIIGSYILFKNFSNHSIIEE